MACNLTRLAALAGALVPALGCATVTGQAKLGVSLMDFPRPEEVGRLPGSSQKHDEGRRTVEVDRWEVETPVPAPGSPYPDTTAWDRLLLETFADPDDGTGLRMRTRPSPELACAAHEMARFYVQHDGFPDQSLRDFLAVSCGSTHVNLESVARYVLMAKEGDAVPANEVRSMLSELAPVGNGRVGLGYASNKERAAVVAVSGEERVRLPDFAPIVQGIGVTISGDLGADAEYTIGVINHGEIGVKRCEPDRAVLPPRFKLFCPLPSGEEVSRLQVAVRRPGRVMIDLVVDALVRTSAEAPLIFEPRLYGPTSPAATAGAFQSQLYTALNEARKLAGVPALLPEALQADTNSRLLAPLLSAAARNDSALEDKCALGMLAGWDVRGTISGGGLSSATFGRERRAGRWVGRTLAGPIARWILLDPLMSRVAAGVNELQHGGMAAVVTTYSLLDRAATARSLRTLQAELTSRRGALQRRRPTFAKPSVEVLEALKKIREEGISAHSAMASATAALSRSHDKPFAGFSVETYDLRQVSWPSALLSPKRLEVEIGVTQYKPKGAAWAQYAVVFVTHPNTPPG